MNIFAFIVIMLLSFNVGVQGAKRGGTESSVLFSIFILIVTVILSFPYLGGCK